MDPASPSPERAAALGVIRALRANGHEAYFAGGSVRDDVMGLEPKDFDVTTSATPDQVIALFDRTVEIGAQFGVIVVLRGEHEIEVATFRTESGYADGRRPDQVAWTTAREDVLRRDFTINGLLADPFAEDLDARVIDHVGGLADIDAQVIRAIGDPTARFEEDQLRLLRALRFAARLDFALESATWSAIQTLAPTIESVSAERIRDELQRTLTEGGARRGWTLLEASGILPHVLSEPPDAARVLARLEDLPMGIEEAWTTVLLDVPRPATAIPAWGRRLKTSSRLARHITQAVCIAADLLDYEARPVAWRKRLLRRPESSAACTAAARAAAAGQRPAAPAREAQADAKRWTPADLRPVALIDGGTLRDLGHAPGPAFKVALDAVEDAQLEGREMDEAAAVALAVATLQGKASPRG